MAFFILQYKLPWILDYLTLIQCVVMIAALLIYCGEKDMPNLPDRDNFLRDISVVSSLIYLILTFFCGADYLMCVIPRVLTSMIVLNFLSFLRETFNVQQSFLLNLALIFIIEVPQFFYYKSQTSLFLLKNSNRNQKLQLESILNVIPESVIIFNKDGAEKPLFQNVSSQKLFWQGQQGQRDQESESQTNETANPFKAKLFSRRGLNQHDFRANDFDLQSVLEINKVLSDRSEEHTGIDTQTLTLNMKQINPYLMNKKKSNVVQIIYREIEY